MIDGFESQWGQLFEEARTVILIVTGSDYWLSLLPSLHLLLAPKYVSVRQSMQGKLDDQTETIRPCDSSNMCFIFCMPHFGAKYRICRRWLYMRTLDVLVELLYHLGYDVY